MATTQYIGARYVPLFFTNPDDNSNNWKSGVVYDPLTIVTDLNQSYTSKIPVPASVGRPSENPTYWILTGAYNAQVAQLATDVQQNTEDIADLQLISGKRTFILIGDSFEMGIDGDDTSTTVPGGGWGARCQTMLEAAGHTVYRSDYNVNGSGFASTMPWINVLQHIVNDIVPDPAAVTDIVVIGGHNDRAFVGTTLIPAIRNFGAYAKTACPHAKLKIGVMSTAITDMWNGVVGDYRQGASQAGAEFTASLVNLMSNPSYIGADGLHLTFAGYQFCGPFVLQGILGEAQYTIPVSYGVTFETGITGSMTVKQVYTPHSVETWIDGDSLHLPSSPSAGVNNKIGTLSVKPAITLNYHTLEFALLVGSAPEGKQAFVPSSGGIFLINGEIYYRLYGTEYPAGNVTATWRLHYDHSAHSMVYNVI